MTVNLDTSCVENQYWIFAIFYFGALPDKDMYKRYRYGRCDQDDTNIAETTEMKWLIVADIVDFDTKILQQILLLISRFQTLYQSLDLSHINSIQSHS